MALSMQSFNPREGITVGATGTPQRNGAGSVVGQGEQRGRA